MNAASALDLALTCDLSKMNFTQANGCANDYGIQFCAPTSLLSFVHTTAPMVKCGKSGDGFSINWRSSASRWISASGAAPRRNAAAP